MRTGNLISPSHTPSLPPRPLFAVFFPFSVGGLLRRVAGWGVPASSVPHPPERQASFLRFLPPLCPGYRSRPAWSLPRRIQPLSPWPALRFTLGYAGVCSSHQIGRASCRERV